MLRPGVHLVLHLAAPAALARLAWPRRWVQAWLIMLCGMLIDLDHLLADTLYDPLRCSLTAHPLHGPLPAALYLALAVAPRTRLLGAGLLLHLALDGADCLMM